VGPGNGAVAIEVEDVGEVTGRVEARHQRALKGVPEANSDRGGDDEKPGETNGLS
jgi:hypothetical protein